MCLALYREDPSPAPVPASQVHRTLAMLRAEPARGRVLVLDHGGRAIGYAILISYWSNEQDGELCSVDELFVAEPFRNHGLGTRLLDDLAAGSALWPGDAVGVSLEVTPANRRARAFYERLGFAARNTTMARKTIAKGASAP